jgi:cytochrome c553
MAMTRTLLARSAQLAACLVVLAVTLTALPYMASAEPIEEKVQLCNACHGENGVPQEKQTPVIWGQHQGYLYLQLRDYKRGTRKSDPMSIIVESLERDEMMALAAYFAAKPWPRLDQPQAAAEVAAEAQRANVALNCTGCHQGAYQGDGTQPRLAGQSREYLVRSMMEFRNRTRGNNPGMSDLMIAISEEAIAACAEYLAGLR